MGELTSWLYRVQDDELSTLLRASAKFASKGYDPVLEAVKAKEQARGQERRELEELDKKFAGGGSASSGAGASGTRSHGSRHSAVKKMPATPYESTWSSRTLAATMPSRGVRPTMTAVKPTLAAVRAATPLDHARRPRTTQDGVIIPSTQAYLGDPTKGAYSMLRDIACVPVGASASSLNTNAALQQAREAEQRQQLQGLTNDAHDEARSTLTSAGSYRPCEALLPKPYAGPKAAQLLSRYPLLQVAGEERASGPSTATTTIAKRASVGPEGAAGFARNGAVTHTLQATQAGSTLPGTPGLHRGGTGVLVGRLTVQRQHLVPATLVAAKWGRVRRTEYGASIHDPVSLTLEMQPLFYESFLADTADVTEGGQFQFVPEVSPAVFLVDIGTANKTVHGAEPSDEDPLLEAREDHAAVAAEQALLQQQQLQRRRWSASGTSSAAADHLQLLQDGDVAGERGQDQDVGGVTAASVLRARARAGARLPYEALKRHEIREAVKQARVRAEEYLLGLARVGDEPAIARVLTSGYNVDYTPHPWYRNIAEESAADRRRGRSRQRSRSGSRSGARPRSGSRSSRSATATGAAGDEEALVLRGRGGGRHSATSMDAFVLEAEGSGGGATSFGDTTTSRALVVGGSRGASSSLGPRPGSRGLLTSATAAVASMAGADSQLRKEIIPILPDVNCADREGNTPLMLAARNGWLETVRLLLKHGANHRRRNSHGQTAHDLARMESELASTALGAALPGSGDRKQRAALTAALLDDRSLLEVAAKGDLRRVRHLLEQGHPINGANAYGMTALHFAVMKADVDMVRLLASRGANASARNNVGQTPASLCMDAVSSEAVGPSSGNEGLQAALLDALNEGPETVRRRELAAARERDRLEAAHKADVVLARKLREVTRGTTAAKAVALAMGGAAPQFGPPMGGGGKKKPAGTAAAAPATTTTPSTPAAVPPSMLQRQPLNAAQREDIERSAASLKESWNRHALNYVILQQKAVAERDAKQANTAGRSHSVVSGERRRHQDGGVPFTPKDAWRVQQRASAAAAEPTPPHDDTPAAASDSTQAAAVFAIWSTHAMRESRGQRSAEQQYDPHAGLADPGALTKELKEHAPPPNPSDRRFELWMKMRFGAGV